MRRSQAFTSFASCQTIFKSASLSSSSFCSSEALLGYAIPNAFLRKAWKQRDNIHILAIFNNTAWVPASLPMRHILSHAKFHLQSLSIPYLILELKLTLAFQIPAICLKITQSRNMWSRLIKFDQYWFERERTMKSGIGHALHQPTNPSTLKDKLGDIVVHIHQYR